jgi:hypothetical protein
MFLTRTAAVIGAFLVSAALAATPPAVAGDEPLTKVVLRDGTGDVWRMTLGSADKVRRPAADVKRAVVRHVPATVRVRMRFADLRRAGSQSYQVTYRTPGGGYYLAVLESLPGARSGRSSLWGMESERRLRCPELRHRIDYARDLVALSVPRSCLGDPSWVRVNMTNLLAPLEDPTGDGRIFVDNPHNHRPWSEAFTPRLYRS